MKELRATKRKLQRQEDMKMKAQLAHHKTERILALETRKSSLAQSVGKTLEAKMRSEQMILGKGTCLFENETVLI